MPDASIPALLALDERVLHALRPDVGQRGQRVAQLVHGTPGWRCSVCDREVPADDRLRRVWAKGEPIRCTVCLERAQREARDAGGWLAMDDMPRTLYPVLRTTPEHRREVREILRGLERVDQARQAGGWWRAARPATLAAHTNAGEEGQMIEDEKDCEQGAGWEAQQR